MTDRELIKEARDTADWVEGKGTGYTVPSKNAVLFRHLANALERALQEKEAAEAELGRALGLVTDLAVNLTEEGASYSHEGLDRMRYGVIEALSPRRCPAWILGLLPESARPPNAPTVGCDEQPNAPEGLQHQGQAPDEGTGDTPCPPQRYATKPAGAECMLCGDESRFEQRCWNDDCPFQQGEPEPRHLTVGEQQVMHQALRASTELISEPLQGGEPEQGERYRAESADVHNQDGILVAQCPTQEIAQRIASALSENDRLRKVLEPFVAWLDHICATGSRRLADAEWPPISGSPNMGKLREAKAALEGRDG